MAKLSELKGLCLHIMCRGCDCVMARRVEEFIDECGDIEIEELAGRMRCKRCGSRSPTLSPWTGGPFRWIRDPVL